MSRKVFTAGEVLAAADVNSFLMDQTVMSFAGTAARGSAIPTPTEGMVTFLEDSNLLSINDGSAWRPSLATVGGILQVVTGRTDTVVSSTSASFIDTGLTATITPKSASSRILIMANHNGVLKSSDNSDNGVNFRLMRGATVQAVGGLIGYTGNAIQQYDSFSIFSTHTSGATSALTFSTQFRNEITANIVQVQVRNAESTIVLMEIAN